MLSRVLLIVICAGLAETAYGQLGRQSSLPTQRELERFGLERGWWSQATLNPANDRLVYLTADEENVYAQSRGGIVTAFDAESGKRLWARLLGPADAPSFPAVTNADQLLVATGMNMYAVNKFNGRLLWRLNLPHHPTTSPGVSDKHAFIGTLDGSAYAFNLATIRQLFQDQLLPEWSDVSTVWRFRAGGAVSSPPVTSGLQVNFTSEDGSLYSVDVNDGSLRFQFETNGAIRTPIARNQDSLFVASEDVRLFSINSQNGKLRWTFISGTPILKEPQVIGQQVFVTPQMGGLYALDTFNGSVQWHQTRATEFLAATTDSLFASDDLGHVLVLSRNDGAITGAIPMRGMSVRVNNDRTDRVYIACPTGLVICLRQRGSEFPTYHLFPDRQPMLPEFSDDAPVEPSEASP
ncbi:MAG: PQQ-binding-like beta-propeller repeat protein [Planctomycetaceae bacterium]|nr:PQQ-binding-like beta-propeller repeat protein [Planctomycetaceae bacterium]